MTESSNPYQSPSEETPPRAPLSGKSWIWPLLMVLSLTAAAFAAFAALAYESLVWDRSELWVLVALAILALPAVLRTWWLVRRRLREGDRPDFRTINDYLVRSTALVIAIAFAGYVAFGSVCTTTGLFTFQLHGPSPTWPWWVGGAAGWGATIWATRAYWLKTDKTDEEQDKP